MKMLIVIGPQGSGNHLFGKINNGTLYTNVHIPWKELSIESIKIPRPSETNVMIYIQYQ